VQHHEFEGKGPPPNQQGLPLSELLAAVGEPTQYRDLVGFSRRRLRWLAAAPGNQRSLASLDPEEVVAEAVLQVSLGEMDPRLGRRLSTRQRASTGAFIHSLKDIIKSNLNNRLQRMDARQEHLPLDDELDIPGSVDPADPADLNARLIHRDLQRVIFERLYRAVAAKPALLPAVRNWEAEFLNAVRIGDRAEDRNLSHRLRRLVQGILDDLASELGPGNTGGREMLL
jgi:hypothetical protein